MSGGKITAGSGVVEVVEFQPTPRMVAARKKVRELVDMGHLSPMDWLNVMREESDRKGFIPLMTSDEWREWQRKDMFEDWFYEDLYPKPSIHHLRSMNDDYLTGVQTALKKGDPVVLKWYREEVIAKSSTDDAAISDIIMSQNKWKARKPAGESE